MEIAEEISKHVQKEEVSIVKLSNSPDFPLKWWKQRQKEERNTRPGCRAGSRTCRYFPACPASRTSNMDATVSPLLERPEKTSLS